MGGGLLALGLAFGGAVVLAEVTAAPAQGILADVVVRGDGLADGLRRTALKASADKGVVVPEFGRVYRPAAAAAFVMLALAVTRA